MVETYTLLLRIDCSSTKPASRCCTLLSTSGSCSTGGGNQYTCTWPATTGPATFTVDTLLTVTVPVSSAPVDLTDTAVLDADENPNNNQASAVVNVRVRPHGCLSFASTQKLSVCSTTRKYSMGTGKQQSSAALMGAMMLGSL